MLRAFLAYVRALFNEVVKFKKWLRNPTNGQGRYVDPSNRHYLSSGMTFAVILAYRTDEAV